MHWAWFIVAALAFSYIGRKVGWAISRSVLYKAPASFAVGACLLWGLLVCIMIQALITWLHPGTALRWIFGYALGYYVSVVNFGLLHPSSIPESLRGRHLLVSILPMLTYTVASIAFGLGWASLHWR